MSTREEEQRGRAAKLRNQVSKRNASEEVPSEKKPAEKQPDESPLAYVDRRSREIARKKSPRE